MSFAARTRVVKRQQRDRSELQRVSPRCTMGESCDASLERSEEMRCRVGPASGAPGTPGRERRPTRIERDTRNGGPALASTTMSTWCPTWCPPSWSHPGPRRIRGIWALGWKNTPNNFVPRGTAKRVRAEGPTHRPAKGNALEDGRQEDGFLGPTGQPVFSGDWLGRWPERPPSHGHLDPGRCPSLGDLTPVPGSHARARNKSGINCHPCPLCTFARASPTLQLELISSEHH